MTTTKLKTDIQILRDYFVQRVNTLEADLLEACRRVDEPAAAGILAELLKASHVRRTSEAVAAQIPDAPKIPTYLLSTLTIREAVAVLTQTADEDLRFATGVVVSPGTYAITTLLPFELRRKSRVAAEGDPEGVARLLIGLHNIDHKLLLTAHSHPGTGPGSTSPSSVDMDFHQRLEAGNYPVVGMIVNREGYFRFFSHKRAFKVSLFGKGMEVISEQSSVFKLNSVGTV